MEKQNIFKKILTNLTLAGLLAPVLISVKIASGQSFKSAAEELAKGSPITSPQQIFTILTNIIKYVYTIFFVVAIIFILIAAFNFLTAKDNPEKIKGARNQIMWAVVAIVVALMAVGVRVIIENFLKQG